MGLYPTAATIGNSPFGPPTPLRSLDLERRLAMTWDRTHRFRTGRYCKLRLYIERRVEQSMKGAARMALQLGTYVRLHPEEERPRELLAAIDATHPGQGWLLDDPLWDRRTYERRTRGYLPRAAWGQAFAFLRAVQTAAWWWRAAMKRLDKARDEAAALARARAARIAYLVTTASDGRARVEAERQAGAAAEEKKLINPYPDGGLQNKKDAETRAKSEDWRASAARVAARNGWTPPDDAM